jgi:ABC-type Na+ transport system ATPase subunit NatA
VSQICQKVVIINEGRVVLEEDMAALTRSGSLEEVFLRAIAKETVEETGVSSEEQG